MVRVNNSWQIHLGCHRFLGVTHWSELIFLLRSRAHHGREPGRVEKTYVTSEVSNCSSQHQVPTMWRHKTQCSLTPETCVGPKPKVSIFFLSTKCCCLTCHASGIGINAWATEMHRTDSWPWGAHYLGTGWLGHKTTLGGTSSPAQQDENRACKKCSGCLGEGGVIFSWRLWEGFRKWGVSCEGTEVCLGKEVEKKIIPGKRTEGTETWEGLAEPES